MFRACHIERSRNVGHDDVELREANGAPKKGKKFNLDFEHDFINNQLEEFVRYDVKNLAVNGNHSFYTAEMELKLKDGSTMKFFLFFINKLRSIGWYFILVILIDLTQN